MIVNHGSALPLLDEHKQVLKQNMCYSLSSVRACVRVCAHDPECESQESQTGFIMLQTSPLWFGKIIQTFNSCCGNAMSPLFFFSFFQPPSLVSFFTSVASTHSLTPPPPPPLLSLYYITLNTHTHTKAQNCHACTHKRGARSLFLTATELHSNLPPALSHCLPAA